MINENIYFFLSKMEASLIFTHISKSTRQIFIRFSLIYRLSHREEFNVKFVLEKLIHLPKIIAIIN